MGKRRALRELWWEDEDLHVVLDDTGEEVVFEGAWMAAETLELGDLDGKLIVAEQPIVVGKT